MIEKNIEVAGLAENPELPNEEKEKPSQILEEYLAYLQDCGIKTLSVEQIKKQLEEAGTAIVTHKFLDGIRISKIGEGRYKTWTTNSIEAPHPLSVKFGGKEISIE